jgi:hypothetical protein
MGVCLDHSLIAEMARGLREDIDREILEELMNDPRFHWMDIEEFLNGEINNG